MCFKKCLLPLLVFTILGISGMGIFSCPLVYAESITCKKTSSSMFVWGKAMIGNQPLKKGDMIAASVPAVEINDGCVGLFTIDIPGSYGAMPIYGDDSTTPEQDGVRSEDTIYFKIITEEGKLVYELAETVDWKGAGEIREFDVIVAPKELN